MFSGSAAANPAVSWDWPWWLCGDCLRARGAKDAKVEAAVRGVQALKLPGLSKPEARGVMEYYARSGMFRNTITEGLVSEKWTLAGSGIVGELERATVRARF